MLGGRPRTFPVGFRLDVSGMCCCHRSGTLVCLDCGATAESTPDHTAGFDVVWLKPGEFTARCLTCAPITQAEQGG